MLGEELRLARLRARKTQKQVAREVGVSDPIICLIERGEITPSPELEEKLKRATGWTPEIALLFCPERSAETT